MASQAWLNKIFDADQAHEGGIVRRSIDSIERYSSLALVVEEARRRRFHVIETGDQVVILCHDGQMVVHC